MKKVFVGVVTYFCRYHILQNYGNCFSPFVFCLSGSYIKYNEIAP